MIKEIKDGLSSTCTHAVPGGSSKKTRFEVIHDLLEAQGEVQPGSHHLKLDKAYLRCTLCNNYVLAKAGEEIFHRFLGEVCHHGPLDPSLWQGHPTHEMTRMGNLLECQKCHLRTRFNNGQITLTTKLRGPCSKPRSVDIRSWLA